MAGGTGPSQNTGPGSRVFVSTVGCVYLTSHENVIVLATINTANL